MEGEGPIFIYESRDTENTYITINFFHHAYPVTK